MAILYNLTPLEAMDLFYDGEKHGVWNGDFIKLEKKNGVKVPDMLREFLEKYGYLDMNKGQIILFHPDDMRDIELNTSDGGKIHILAMGKIDDMYAGIELDSEDLNLAVGEVTEGRIMWGPSDITLQGLMTIMFVSLLYKSSDNYVYRGLDIDNVLKTRGAERSKISPSQGSIQHTSLNFDEENGAFITAEFDPQGEEMVCLSITPRKTYEQRKAERYASITLDELNSLFEGEFFGNATHCDFEHALELKLEIIKRLEQSDTDPLELTDHYKAAGRCLWALERLDEAKEWYDKAGNIIENSGDHEKTADFYHTLGNFYADTKHWEESSDMYEKELSIRRKNFPDDVYTIGMCYMSQAQFLDKDNGDPDRVIELCNLALEEFKKDPHESGCKYETARAYQLRADAKRRKKGMDKS